MKHHREAFCILIPLSADACNKTMTSRSTKMQKATTCLVTDAVKEVNQLVRGQVKCPIHEGNVLRGHCNKKSGRTFYGCTVETCPVFCSDDKLRDYCDVVEKKTTADLQDLHTVLSVWQTERFTNVNFRKKPPKTLLQLQIE